MNTTKRAVLYLRQSTFREESISLELQESAGREYCASKGYAVVAVESDPGISGRTWKRPAVQRVMTMVEQREADVIVLWKWSRLSRSRLDWAVAADRVQQAGGEIESATEPLDATTAVGRLARGMLTEFAAFESERMGDVWKETHARRTAAGLPANGKPRFGYDYDAGSGFAPNATTGPLLAHLYRSYISGVSIYALVVELNGTDHRPSAGYGRSDTNLWSDRTLRRVLDSGFGAGYINVHGERRRGAHDAVITSEEWDAYLEARERRRVSRRTERSAYMLSGLVWCSCGSKMHGGMFTAAGTPKLRCAGASGSRRHPGGYITESIVNEAVYAWLREQATKVDESTASGTTVVPTPPHGRSRQRSMEARLSSIATKLDTLTERFVSGEVKQGPYERLTAKWEAEVAQIESDLRRMRVIDSRAGSFVPSSILDVWEDIGIEKRREMIREVIAKIMVTPGRPRGTVVIQPVD